MRDHVHAIKRHPGMANAQIVFMSEKIMGHSSGHLFKFVRDIPGVTSVWTQVDAYGMGIGDPGFRTHSAEVKMLWANATRDYVSECALTVMEDLICSNSFVAQDTRLKDVWEKLDRQMRAYRTVATRPENPHSADRQSIGGVYNKYDKKDASMNDDLMDAFAMCCFMVKMLMNNEMPNFDHARVPNKFAGSFAPPRGTVRR